LQNKDGSNRLHACMYNKGALTSVFKDLQCKAIPKQGRCSACCHCNS